MFIIIFNDRRFVEYKHFISINLEPFNFILGLRTIRILDVGFSLPKIIIIRRFIQMTSNIFILSNRSQSDDIDYLLNKPKAKGF